MTIKAAVRAEPHILALDTIIDIVIKEIYAQVVNSLDQLASKTTSATTMVAINKNQNELLRCFAELSVQYSDKLVPFLIQTFEKKDEKTRIASLTVLKHMINSCKEHMENKKQLVVSGLRLLVNEMNNKVAFKFKSDNPPKKTIHWVWVLDDTLIMFKILDNKNIWV